MKKPLLLTAVLLLAAPIALAQDNAQAGGATSSQNAPAPSSPNHAGTMGHNWRPGRGGDRRDDRGRGMERGGRPGHGWDRGGRGGPGGEMLPFGMWWKNPEVAQRIGLNAGQQKQIEDIFLQSRLQLIQLHASLESEQLLLEPLLSAEPFDEAKALAQINKIADTRADLEKTNAKMLLNIRGVLSADQWTKLRERDHMPLRPEGPWGNKDGGPGPGNHG